MPSSPAVRWTPPSAPASAATSNGNPPDLAPHPPAFRLRSHVLCIDFVHVYLIVLLTRGIKFHKSYGETDIRPLRLIEARRCEMRNSKSRVMLPLFACLLSLSPL